MTTMPVISVRQPWAWAILHAGKDIENRSWPTKHRGPLLIHASMTSKAGDVDALIDISDRTTRFNVPGWVVNRAFKGKSGGIVGVVTVMDCVQNHPSPWAIPGQWHWVLADAKALPFWACKGRLGIWRVDYPHEVPAVKAAAEEQGK